MAKPSKKDEAAALTRIEAVWIESSPFSRIQPGVIHDEYVDLPEPFLEELAELYARSDSARCARCSDSVGFALGVQSSGFERLDWTPTGLSREDDGPVVVLCGECTPYVPEPQTS